MKNKCKLIKSDTVEQLEENINEFLNGLEGEWAIQERIIQHVITKRDNYSNSNGDLLNDYFGYWVCFIFYV